MTNPAAFQGLTLPLPPNSLVFLCAKGQPGTGEPPPGVLGIPGIHYTVGNGTFQISPNFTLNAGDLVYVVTL